MARTVELRIGSRFAFNGMQCTVVEFAGDELVIRDSSASLRRIRLVELLQEMDWIGTGGSAAVLSIAWAEATPANRAAAEERAAHIRELWTGYRSGASDNAEPGEPRQDFHPELSLSRRRRAKAAEIGCGRRTLLRWESAFADGGVIALLDRRGSRASSPLANLDPRWVHIAYQILDEERDKSAVGIGVLLARIEARALREHGDSVRIPGQSSGYHVLGELARSRGTFRAGAKGRRSIALRPAGAPYGRLVATRPGEYVLLDSTPLNVFGLVPISGEWLRAELTVAMDLYDRSILGLRLAPVTKSIDVAGVLFEAIQPVECPPEWGERARWPFHGIASGVILGEGGLLPRFDRPGIIPETIVIDHGRPYMSEHVQSVCRRLGISIQPAHVYTPTDKAQVERFFRTVDSLLQELPGYTGRDVASRGLRPEEDSVYTMLQLEQIIREWIATVYHLRPHEGLVDVSLPGVKMSPAERYQQGIAVAGRITVPANPNLLLEMLPVELRTFQHYGVEIGGLRYSGEIVAKYRDRRRSSSPRRQRWPFAVNPDDRSKIYFNDPEDGCWHTLDWEHAQRVNEPFTEDALEYAKRIALDPEHPTDVKGALVALLERWHAGRADSAVERRISARLAAQMADSAAGFDRPNMLRTAQALQAAEVINSLDTADSVPIGGDDDLDEELDETPAVMAEL